MKTLLRNPITTSYRSLVLSLCLFGFAATVGCGGPELEQSVAEQESLKVDKFLDRAVNQITDLIEDAGGDIGDVVGDIGDEFRALLDIVVGKLERGDIQASDVSEDITEILMTNREYYNRLTDGDFHTCALYESPWWPNESEWAAVEDAWLEEINGYRRDGFTCQYENDDGSIVEYRFKPGAPPLVKNDELTCAARRHSGDMSMNNFYAHEANATDGSDIGSRQDWAGYDDPEYAWESIAKSATILNAWMHSKEGHCHAAMNPTATEVGFGFAKFGRHERKTGLFGGFTTIPEDYLVEGAN